MSAASHGSMAGASAANSVSAEVEDLRRAVAEQRAQLAELAGKAGSAASSRARAISEDIVEGFDDATRAAARRGRRARRAVEDRIQSHPMMAVGVAAGLGVLLGLFLRR